MKLVYNIVNIFLISNVYCYKIDKRQDRTEIFIRNARQISNRLNRPPNPFQNNFQGFSPQNQQNNRRPWITEYEDTIQGEYKPRISFDYDSIIFKDSDESQDRKVRTTKRTPFRTTMPVDVPGMGTTMSPCELKCQITPQWDPICGDDNITYTNRARFNCAQKCGKRVRMVHLGTCTRRGPNRGLNNNN